MIGADWSTHETVRRLCLQSIRNENPMVRQAALQVLVNARDATTNPAVLGSFKDLLTDADESIQAGVIPALIASHKEEFAAPGKQKLAEWLASQGNRRMLALQVLAKTGDPSLLERLQDDLHSSQTGTRLDAVKLISELLLGSAANADTRKLALEKLSTLIADVQESVQLEVINILGKTKTPEAARMMLPALHSESFVVRKTACDLIEFIPEDELEAGLNSTSVNFAESAAYLLARRGSLTGKRRVMELMDMLVFDVHQIYAHRLALADKTKLGGSGLLDESLFEQAHLRLERFFWLLSTLCNWEDAQNIRTAMGSPNRATRANAVEALESLSSPRMARLISPLLDGDELANVVKIGREVLNIPAPTINQVFLLAWPQLALDTTRPIVYSSGLLTIYADDWIKSVAIFALIEMHLAGQNDVWPGDAETRIALQKTIETGSPLSSEEARLALTKLDKESDLIPRE
jgi:HEAT repeat protein